MELYRIAIRAVFVFLTLHALVRASGKRTVHEGTAFDFVLALILGDVVDDLLWGEVSGSRFAAAVGALALAHSLVAWLNWWSPSFARLAVGTPALVVKSGRFLATPMRRERVSRRDVESMLRAHGVPEDVLPDVREARVEYSGELSVLREPAAQTAQRRDVRTEDRE